jgi:hypothetical protein
MAKQSKTTKVKTVTEYLLEVFNLVQYALLIKKNFGQRALTLFLKDNMPKHNAEIIELWLSKERQTFKEFKTECMKDGIRKRKYKRL